MTKDELIGKYASKDIFDKNKKYILQAGHDLTEEVLGKISSESINSLEIVSIDPINKGPYLSRNIKN